MTTDTALDASHLVVHVLSGDHTGFLLDPGGGQILTSGKAVITLNDVRDLHPGHEP